MKERDLIDDLFACHHCDAPRTKQVLVESDVQKYGQFGTEKYFCKVCEKTWTFMR